MRKDLCIPYHIQRRKASRPGVISHRGSIHALCIVALTSFSFSRKVYLSVTHSPKGDELVPNPQRVETIGRLTATHSGQVYHPEQEKSDTSPEYSERH